MSSISGGTTTSTAIASSLIAASAASGASQKASSSSTAPSSSFSDPVDKVDLSDLAKLILARAKNDQLAADKLSELVQSLRDPDGKNLPTKANSNDGPSLFDQLSGSQGSSQSVATQWEAGSKYGDPSISDSDFLSKYKETLLGYAEGLPPEQRQALEGAVSSGTIQLQKASEVVGLNTRSNVTYSGSPGGLQGMAVSHQSNPTGAAKDTIDQGRAYVFWTEDRGDVYVTW